MNQFSLTFTNTYLEERYRKIQHQREFVAFKLIYLLYSIFSGICLLLAIVNFALKSVVFYSLILMFLSIARFFGRRQIVLFNMMIMFSVLILNFMIPYGIQQNDSYYLVQDHFYRGQSISFSSFVLLLGTQFYFKGFVYLFNCITQVFFILNDDKIPKLQYFYFFIVYSLVMIIKIYILEKETRFKFLLQIQTQQFDSILFKQLNIGIIECLFDERINNSILKSQNQFAQKMFLLKDRKDFTKFLRNMKLKNLNFQKSKEKPQINNLENLLFYIFANQCAISKKHLTLKLQYNFQGIYNKKLYEIKLALISSIKPFIILLIDEKQQEKAYKKVIQQLSLARTIISTQQQKLQVINVNAIKSLQQIIKSPLQLKNTFIWNNLIFFHELIKIGLLNINWYLYGIQEKDYLKIASCCLKNQIQQIIQFFDPLIKFKKLVIQLNLNDNFTINSLPVLTKQLLSNLILNSIKFSPPNSFISFTLERINENNLNSFIRFSIKDEASSFISNMISSLPIINPTKLKSFEKINVSRHQLKLGLAISIQILSFIGFKDNIYVYQNETNKEIGVLLLVDVRGIQQKNMKKDINIQQKLIIR